MIKEFLAEGFTYFDTAHGYLNGQSEKALKDCLTSVFPRSAYTITDKLTENFFNSEEDIDRVFADQLQCVGLDYFDYYLMHSQNAGNYGKFQRCHAYEKALGYLKKGGSIILESHSTTLPSCLKKSSVTTPRSNSSRFNSIILITIPRRFKAGRFMRRPENMAKKSS